jgi:hypothetical protein
MILQLIQANFNEIDPLKKFSGHDLERDRRGVHGFARQLGDPFAVPPQDRRHIRQHI